LFIALLTAITSAMFVEILLATQCINQTCACWWQCGSV